MPVTRHPFPISIVGDYLVGLLTEVMTAKIDVSAVSNVLKINHAIREGYLENAAALPINTGCDSSPFTLAFLKEFYCKQGHVRNKMELHLFF